MSFFGSRSRNKLGADVLDQQKLQPVEQFRRGGLFLQPRHLAHLVEQPERLRDQPLLDAGEVHLDDRLHGVDVGEADVVKEAAAQERVRQLFLVVGRDDHDRPPPGLHRLAGFVDEELHAVELEQKIVGKLDIGLVDLVDQEDRPLLRNERVPHLAALDVVTDVAHPLVAELAVAQPRHCVVFVEALHGLGGGFDVPLDQRCVQALCDFQRQNGLTRAGFAFHQQGALEGDRRIDRNLEIVGGDIAAGAFKTHAHS